MGRDHYAFRRCGRTTREADGYCWQHKPKGEQRTTSARLDQDDVERSGKTS